MVKVKPTASQGRITVKTSNDTNVFGIKDNLSEYYAKQAENWAHSEGIVNGIDYSSKYYAEQSKASAQVADEAKAVAQELVDNFDNNVQIAKDDIEQNRINSINAIDNTYSVAIGDIQKKSDEVLTSIETSKAEAVDSINSTKTTILSDIEFVAEGEKQEIQGLVDDEKEEIKDLINTGKDELKESIGDVKVLTTLEIGDIGFTQMAIDESKGKRRKLNGQLIIQEQYQQFTQIVKDSVALNADLSCTETEWQTAVTMSANGVCYKYVINDEAGTIRLPKYPTYLDLSINGAKTVSVYGTGKTLGFTNGTQNFGMTCRYQGSANFPYTNTALYNVAVGTLGSANNIDTTNNASIGVTTDASKSGITGSVTTSSEKIKGAYFIQVATGAETEDNIINEIELNNPFSLLDYKYSEYELNNISWLRSQGQYNSKAVYPAVYDLLLKIYNKIETKAGVSVKLSTGSYTDYDFVLNTAEETFRLPIKVKQKFFSGDVPVVGNGNSLGLIDGSGKTFNLSNNANPGYFYPCNAVGGFKTPLGSAVSEVNAQAPVTFGVTTDSSKSGLVAKLGRTEVTGLYLYFYVGETIQNANLINAGRIEEIVATRTDKVQASLASMPSNKFVALTLGASTSAYTAPADGWFSLGGLDSIGAVSNYGFVMRRNDRFGLESRIGATAMTTGWCNGILAVKKGDVVNIYHNMTVSDSQLRFYYNQGEI